MHKQSLKEDFWKKKVRNKNYIIWTTLIVGILLFTGLISDYSIISKIALIISVLTLLTVLLDVAADVQYLEKRIEEIEDSIIDMKEDIN